MRELNNGRDGADKLIRSSSSQRCPLTPEQKARLSWCDRVVSLSRNHTAIKGRGGVARQKTRLKTQLEDARVLLFCPKVNSSLAMRLESVERVERKKQQGPKVTFYNYLHRQSHALRRFQAAAAPQPRSAAATQRRKPRRVPFQRSAQNENLTKFHNVPKISFTRRT